MHLRVLFLLFARVSIPPSRVVPLLPAHPPTTQDLGKSFHPWEWTLSEQVTWRSLLGQLLGLCPENMPMVLTRGGKQNVSALSLKFATKNYVLYTSFKGWVMSSSQSQTSKMKAQLHVSIFLLLLGNPG